MGHVSGSGKSRLKGTASRWRPFAGAAAGLVLANLAALSFYVARDFTPFQLLVMFVMECLWIGVFNALRLMAASLHGTPYDSRNVDVSPGLSVVLSILMIGTLGARYLGLVALTFAGIVFVQMNLADMDVHDFIEQTLDAVVASGSSLFLGHAVSFVLDDLVRGEYRTARVGDLVKWPFRRCFGLMLAVALALGAASAWPSFADTTTFALLAIGCKIVIDLRLYLHERARFSVRVIVSVGDSSNGPADRDAASRSNVLMP